MRITSFRAVATAILVFALILTANQYAGSAPRVAARQDKQTQQQGSQTQQNPPAQAAPSGQGSIAVAVHNVAVDAIVTDNNGNYLKNLKKENFRILEDGKPQEIVSFSTGDAPITMVMLIEFSKLSWGIYGYTARYWGAAFLPNLKKDDWIALEDFDLKMRVDVDFTHNPGEVLEYMRGMIFPGFSEACVRDSLLETLDRLKDVKGKKSILLLASGFDTFSKHTLDQTLNQLKQTDVTVFVVGVGQQVAMVSSGTPHVYGEPYYQAQNEVKAYAALTGGESWFPVFDGEIPGVFQSVAESLRSQYTLGYVPSEGSLDGKYHKIKVELVAPDGGPLTVTNEKGKKVKFVVYAREGYIAPKGGIAD